MQGHTDSVWTVALTSDNKHIVSGSSDNTIRIWNFLEKRQETDLQGHASTVRTVLYAIANLLFLYLLIRQSEYEVFYTKHTKLFYKDN